MANEFSFPNESIRVTRDEKGDVTDIEILVDAKTRSLVLENFPIKNQNWSNSSLCASVHRALATYNQKSNEEKEHEPTWLAQKLHSIRNYWYGEPNIYTKNITITNTEGVMNNVRKHITALAAIEALTNTGSFFKDNETAEDKLNSLSNALNQYHFDILNQLEDFKKTSPLTQNIEKLLQSLEPQITSFQGQIHKLKSKIITQNELRKLFSAQDEEHGIQSLGDFVAKQLMLIIGESIKMLYAIQDDYIEQAFELHQSIKALSDAKSDIEKKAQSFYGARYHNTRTPIPPAMSDISFNIKDTSTEKKWLSITPHLKSLRDPKQIDAILSLELGEFKSKNGDRSWSIVPLFAATVIELGFTTLRLIPTTISFLGSLIPPLRNPMTRFENFIHNIHHRFSLIRITKEKFGVYESFSPERNNLLENILPKEKRFRSEFNHLATHYLSGRRLAESFYETLSQASWTVFSPIFSGLPYFLSTGKNAPSHQASFEKIKEATESLELEQIKALAKQIRDKKTKEIDFAEALMRQESITDSRSSTSSSIFSRSSSIHPEYEEKEDLNFPNYPELGIYAESKVGTQHQAWPGVTAWEPNEYISIFDFFDEIIVGLSDVIIDPMFRKVPGLATFFFMFSQASYATMLFPGAAAMVGTQGSFLETIPASLSQSFTGQPISSGIMNKTIAAFLEWKLGFFGTEFMMEAALHGKFDFLETVAENPEAITLGLFVLIAAGVGLQFMPTLPTTITVNNIEIPNPFAEAINVFPEEAAYCDQGMLPFTAIEYAFLGLKFGLLAQTLLSGQKKPGAKPIDIKKLANDLLESKILNYDNPEDQKHIIARILVDQSIATEADLNEPEHIQLIEKIAAVIQTLQKNPSFNEEKINRSIQNNTFKIPKKLPALQAALQLVEKMGATGSSFSSQKEADLFYDYLDECFDQQNELFRQQGLFHHIIDKRDYLHSFYNRYCYRGSNVAIRVLSTTLFYPLTLLWRAAKYRLAQTNTWYSPSTLHQVEKSWNKDKAMFLQVLAVGARVGRSAARAYAYSARALFVGLGFTLATVCTLGFALFNGDWRRSILSNLSYAATQFAPYRDSLLPTFISKHIPSLRTYLKREYAVCTREAGTNHSDLVAQGQSIVRNLHKSTESYAARATGTRASVLRRAPLEKLENQDHLALAKYYNTQQGRFWKQTNSKRFTQLERASSILSNNVEPEQKRTQLTAIVNELPNGSELKRTINQFSLFHGKVEPQTSSASVPVPHATMSN